MQNSQNYEKTIRESQEKIRKNLKDFQRAEVRKVKKKNCTK